MYKSLISSFLKLITFFTVILGKASKPGGRNVVLSRNKTPSISISNLPSDINEDFSKDHDFIPMEQSTPEIKRELPSFRKDSNAKAKRKNVHYMQRLKDNKRDVIRIKEEYLKNRERQQKEREKIPPGRGFHSL